MVFQLFALLVVDHFFKQGLNKQWCVSHGLHDFDRQLNYVCLHFWPLLITLIWLIRRPLLRHWRTTLSNGRRRHPTCLTFFLQHNCFVKRRKQTLSKKTKHDEKQRARPDEKHQTSIGGLKIIRIMRFPVETVLTSNTFKDEREEQSQREGWVIKSERGRERRKRQRRKWERINRERASFCGCVWNSTEKSVIVAWMAFCTRARTSSMAGWPGSAVVKQYATTVGAVVATMCAIMSDGQKGVGKSIAMQENNNNEVKRSKCEYWH